VIKSQLAANVIKFSYWLVGIGPGSGTLSRMGFVTHSYPFVAEMPLNPAGSDAMESR